MGSNKYIIMKIKCWPVFKQDPRLATAQPILRAVGDVCGAIPQQYCRYICCTHYTLCVSIHQTRYTLSTDNTCTTQRQIDI